MPAVCFYFQVHQPFRLKQYNFFDMGYDHFYEDEASNRQILNKVADKCYIPANEKMLELIHRFDGRFKIAYAISGVALEQFERYRPDVLASFQRLAATGCVEFLSETYYHSLSFLYSETAFKTQVKKHRRLIEKYFNQTPTVFRNTELIYNNELADCISEMGYQGILTEGVDRILGYRSPNFLYQPSKNSKIACLLKNYKLSDDIAFRFSDKNWKSYPLTTKKFAKWIHNIAGNGEVVNLFMDYETFGEHQWVETGIFDFLDQLPAAIFQHPDFEFKTPSEVINAFPTRGIYDVKETISWADSERDLSAWLSNELQQEANRRVYALETKIRQADSKVLTDVWSKLLTSDHFYYMCTKFWEDGDVHKYFSPYNSPYEAYNNYINVLADFEYTLDECIDGALVQIAEKDLIVN